MNIPDTWTFKDRQIAEGFNAHVREQLPWYDLATNAVAHIVRCYLRDGGLVYDIGASTGNMARAISSILDARGASIVSVEESPEMIHQFKAVGVIGEIVEGRAQDVEYPPLDIAICFLVLMFIEPGARMQLVSRLYSKLKPGGCIIVFDKVVSHPGYLGSVMRTLTMNWKLSNGATPEQIISKELSLSGVQRPISSSILGTDAKMFFLFGEFAGWVIEKPE